MKKRTDIGQFVLSKKAVTVLEAFEKEYEKAGNEQSWHDFLEGSLVAVDSALKHMRDIARTDLNG